MSAGAGFRLSTLCFSSKPFPLKQVNQIAVILDHFFAYPLTKRGDHEPRGSLCRPRPPTYESLLTPNDSLVNSWLVEPILSRFEWVMLPFIGHQQDWIVQLDFEILTCVYIFP